MTPYWLGFATGMAVLVILYIFVLAMKGPRDD